MTIESPRYQDKIASFLDVNTFANEEFSSELLINIREMLYRFQNAGITTEIISVAQGHRSKYWKNEQKFGFKQRNIQNLHVNEILLEEQPELNPDIYRDNVHALIESVHPNLILMNTPAVFLENFHIDALEEAIQSHNKVIVLLCDELYPTDKTHPKEKVDAYYSLLSKTTVITCSNRLKNQFYNDTGIETQLFLNLFNIDTVLSNPDDKNQEYVTLINHHPIKGREIFNATAAKMPDKKFLIVENWPDVPEYIPPTENITFSPFVQDIRKLYGKVRILVVPSLCPEGSPRVITEAMLNEIPVIAHRIGGIPELGGNNIHLIEPPEIINQHFSNTVLIPEIEPTELKRVAEEFADTISSIDADQETWIEHSKLAKESALLYCRTADTIFERNISEWFSEV